MKAFILAGLMAIAFPVQADVYKCNDVSGKTVYQEMPCEAANLKAVGKVAKPVGKPSEEAIRKLNEDIKAAKQREAEKMKAEQEATKKANGEQNATQKENSQ